MAHEDFAGDERVLAYRKDREDHLKAHEDGTPCHEFQCPSATREGVENLVRLYMMHLDERSRKGL